MQNWDHLLVRHTPSHTTHPHTLYTPSHTLHTLTHPHTLHTLTHYTHHTPSHTTHPHTLHTLTHTTPSHTTHPHTQHIFAHLHLTPREGHGADISRLREWAVNEWGKYYCQTLVFSSCFTPEINALFNNYCYSILLCVWVCARGRCVGGVVSVGGCWCTLFFVLVRVSRMSTLACWYCIYCVVLHSTLWDHAGRVRVGEGPGDGCVSQVVVQAPQVFHRVQCLSHRELPEARLNYFVEKVSTSVVL